MVDGLLVLVLDDGELVFVPTLRQDARGRSERNEISVVLYPPDGLSGSERTEEIHPLPRGQKFGWREFLLVHNFL